MVALILLLPAAALLILVALLFGAWRGANDCPRCQGWLPGPKSSVGASGAPRGRLCPSCGARVRPSPPNPAGFAAMAAAMILISAGAIVGETTLIFLALPFQLVALVIWCLFQRKRLADEGVYCPACGYDRAGLTAPALCPECGAPPPTAANAPT
jgi:hypothetical protein